MSADVIDQVRALHDQWQEALAQKSAADDTDDWHRAHQQEQDAYDRLVDFVEANGLNYGEYDPRGEEGSL